MREEECKKGIEGGIGICSGHSSGLSSGHFGEGISIGLGEIWIGGEGEDSSRIKMKSMRT